MSLINPLEVALAFVEQINAHNPDGLAELMTADHIFVDSQGHRWQGREEMRQGWVGYYGLFPDYTILIEETFVKDDVVVLLGSASGTYSVNGQLLQANRWQGPAAWKATVRDNLVAYWQVYADNDPVYRIMEANKSS